METTQNVFAQLSGQDDNLGDSELRVSYLDALRGPGRHVHVFLATPTTDYAGRFPVATDVTYYQNREHWARTLNATASPVYAFNAGEINPRPGVYPGPRLVKEATRVKAAGGIVLATGIGIRNAQDVSAVTFDPAFRNAAVMSWRDQGSRDAAGFGDFAPDWAYSLGTHTADWATQDQRPLLAITMRFDRPWPGDGWLSAVRSFADARSTRIVTVTQVARDSPRAVRLAEALDGEYLEPPSMRHDALDEYVRAVYRQSLAVISDRAHGLIMGATEGANPIGSGSNPHKISRLLAAVGLGGLVGRYDEFDEFAARFDAHAPALAPAIDAARADIADLTHRLDAAIDSVR